MEAVKLQSGFRFIVAQVRAFDGTFEFALVPKGSNFKEAVEKDLGGRVEAVENLEQILGGDVFIYA